jgi:hypothetical protein
MATVAAPPKYKAKWLGHLALAHHQTALVQGARRWRSRLRSRPLPSGHSPAVPAAQVEPDASLFVFDAADSAFAGQHEGARPWGSVGSAGLPMPELFAAPSAHTQGSIDYRGRTPCIARPACCSTRTTSIWAKRGCQHNAPRQRSAEGLDVTREVCDMQEQAAPRWMRAGSVLVAKPVAEPARASVATMVELPAHYARLFTIFLTIRRRREQCRLRYGHARRLACPTLRRHCWGGVCRQMGASAKFTGIGRFLGAAYTGSGSRVKRGWSQRTRGALPVSVNWTWG